MYGFAVAASTSTKQLRFSKLPFLSSFFLLYLLNTLSLSPLTLYFEKNHIFKKNRSKQKLGKMLKANVLRDRMLCS